MKVEVAVVGNGVAGTACAMRLVQHGIRPLLIGPGLPVDRPPLTKSALVKGEPVLLADERYLAERGVDRLDAFVDEIDPTARRLRAGDVDIEPDAVVLATGLSYRPPRLPGLEHAHVNATPGGMRALATALAGSSRRVAVIGGGLIGVETAATLAGQGHTLTVLDLLTRPLDRLHDPLPAITAATLAELGVTFVGGVLIDEVVARDGRVTICHKDGSIAADLLVAATGGRIVSPPGLTVDGPVEVAADMRLPGHEWLFACGDLVLVPHERFGPIRFPHWDAAIGTGEQAADSVAGALEPYVRLPYWWSDIGPRRLAEVGFAAAAATWTEEDGLHIGRGVAGEVVCVLVVDEPRRLREARALVQGGES